jgi:hypothetical protein
MTGDLKQKIIGHLLIGSGVGAGGGIVLALAYSVAQKPELLIDALKSFGAQFLLGVIALAFVNQRVGEGLNVLRENSASQQKLADAVSMMATKDDRQDEEQRRLMSFVGTQMEKILERLGEQERAKGASA